MTASDRASIIILTCRGPWHYALINELARWHDVTGIVFEHHSRLKMKLLSRRLRKLGILTVANQMLFKLFHALFLQEYDACKATELLGEDASFDAAQVPNAQVLDTTSINSVPVEALIHRLKPDTVVVSGTSLLGKGLLDSIKSTPVINIHCGITPRYRGNHGAYWAVVNGDWENVGTTIHFIDTGVDTGSIISQATIHVDPADTPQCLGLKQYCAGIPLIPKVVSRIREGSVTTMRRADLDSRIYSSPTLTSYLTFKRRLHERFSQSQVHQENKPERI